MLQFERPKHDPNKIEKKNNKLFNIKVHLPHEQMTGPLQT